MSLVVRDDLSVTIPESVAQEMGLQRGSPVRWERTAGGDYVLRPAETAKPGARLLGFLKPYVTVEQRGLEAFLQWREQDGALDGSL